MLIPPDGRLSTLSCLSCAGEADAGGSCHTTTAGHYGGLKTSQRVTATDCREPSHWNLATFKIRRAHLPLSVGVIWSQRQVDKQGARVYQSGR